MISSSFPILEYVDRLYIPIIQLQLQQHKPQIWPYTSLRDDRSLKGLKLVIHTKLPYNQIKSLMFISMSSLLISILHSGRVKGVGQSHLTCSMSSLRNSKAQGIGLDLKKVVTYSYIQFKLGKTYLRLLF